MVNKSLHNLVIKDNNYEIVDASVRESMADEYSSSSTYSIGDLVLHNGQLYECSTAINTAEAWTVAHWTAVTVGGKISSLKTSLGGKLDEPSTAGTSGQVLTSDGQGGQSWQTPSGEGGGGAVNSVNGKTGTVVLDAGDLAYDGTTTYSSGTVGDELSDLKGEDKLLRSELPGTTQTVTFDSSGNPASITHSASGSTVRTDVFTWSSNSVTEVRTASNKQITITTNLTTLEQTISAITEVA